MAPKIFAYIREPYTDKIGSEISEETQIQIINEFMEKKVKSKLYLNEIFKEKMPYDIDDRPILKEAINKLDKGDTLIVASRAMLGRSPIFAIMQERAVKKKKAQIISAQGEGTLDDRPEDFLQRGIVDALNEFEYLINRKNKK